MSFTMFGQGIISFVMAFALTAGIAGAAELRIAITQSQAGEARKYQPLLEYLGKKGIIAGFTTTQDYQSAAELFAEGGVDAMFCGSGIAATMFIKELAEPVARPVGKDGVSTYSASVIALKGSPKFIGNADYFSGKKVIFAPLASAGEFYFRSLGPSQARELMKAASHGAALDALSRGQADVAVIKNHVWTKEKDKYAGYEMVGGDKGENPDSTLIVSRKVNSQIVQKISDALLALQNDPSAEAVAVRESLKVQGFVKTTLADFKNTLAMVTRAGVTKNFAFKF